MFNYKQKKFFWKSIKQVVLLTFSIIPFWAYLNSKAEVSNYKDTVDIYGTLDSYYRQKIYKKSSYKIKLNEYQSTYNISNIIVSSFDQDNFERLAKKNKNVKLSLVAEDKIAQISIGNIKFINEDKRNKRVLGNGFAALIISFFVFIYFFYITFK